MNNIVFLGSKPLGLALLKCLYQATPNAKWTIIHPNDEVDARSNIKDFQDFAKEHNLDLLVAGNSRAAQEMLSDIKPDVGFVCGWYWLFKAEVLDAIPQGLWGMHNSLLPKYRGASPLVWSIINGDDCVGSTIFRIREGMDDGEILHKVSIKLNDSQNIADILGVIENKMLQELPQKWANLIEGNAVLAMQDESQATYCGQRNETDGLIDWNKPAKEIHNFVRAQTKPYPCAFTYLAGKKIKILSTKVFEGTYYGTPGQVLKRNEKTTLIACGNNTSLEILEVEEQYPTIIIKSIQDRLSAH
jgi:methionyl-tRNA formyltransferase